MPISVDTSILTLVHQRKDALRFMLEGIASMSVLPKECIIVHINEPSYPLPERYPFSVQSYTIFTGDTLNLAAARNKAIEYSSSEYNVFLDVDCIPHVLLLQQYRDQFRTGDVLISGRIRYLPQGCHLLETWKDRLDEISAPDPVREGFAQYPYELFWSLNFGCSRRAFDRIGRFDEGYRGYGAEDTDFAFQARACGIPLHTVDAFAYHQYHPTYNPPLPHLRSIVQNAELFYRKWGTWPMAGWLNAFESMGFIARTHNSVQILRIPSEKEVASCLKR